MNIIDLYQDFGIITPDTGHKHCSPGWINAACPHCAGNEGFHLGFNIQHNYFNCRRCGHNGVEHTISKLLGVNYRKAKEIIRQYKGKTKIKSPSKSLISVKKKAFRLPPNTSIDSYTYALKYMQKRGFKRANIQKIVNDFRISATNPVCPFKMNNKEVDLKFRILTPIFHKNKEVSWQTRDCAGNSGLKYITCPKEIELKHHKNLIYFNPAKWDNLPGTLILTEGIFDVWKIHLADYFAGCGFGVELTIDQVLWIKKNFKKVILFLDSDLAGLKKAKYLFNQLSFSGLDCITVTAPKGHDPGSMGINEIDKVLKGIVSKTR